MVESVSREALKSRKKSMVSNYLQRKNRGKKNKNKKVTNFKKGLTMLDDAVLLINTSKGPDYMSVPFASITNKLNPILPRLLNTLQTWREAYFTPSPS